MKYYTCDWCNTEKIEHAGILTLTPNPKFNKEDCSCMGSKKLKETCHHNYLKIYFDLCEKCLKKLNNNFITKSELKCNK